jgi:hypothetical protein
LSLNSETKFYLASDSTFEKKKIVQLFGKKIITADVYQGRDEVDAMADALMDLYVLANMRKIVGSYWSSFTLTAISYLSYLKPYQIVK